MHVFHIMHIFGQIHPVNATINLDRMCILWGRDSKLCEGANNSGQENGLLGATIMS